MKQLTFRLISSCILLTMLSACAQESSPTNAPADTPNTVTASKSTASPPARKSPLEGIVSASTEKVEIRAGETAETSIRLTITNGYHVNANPATEKFLIPTSLEVKPEAGIKVDNIVYPKSIRKKFRFAEVPLDVYEGDAVIKLSLSAQRSTALPGEFMLTARVRVQPCDDEKCYPPATLETTLPVTIR